MIQCQTAAPYQKDPCRRMFAFLICMLTLLNFFYDTNLGSILKDRSGTDLGD